MPANWRTIGRVIVPAHFAIAATTLLCSSPVLADGSASAPAFMMTWDVTGDSQPSNTYDPTVFGTVQYGTWNLGGPAGDRVRTGWLYEGGFSGTGGAWDLDWQCVVDPDPFVDASITVTNNMASTQTFDMYMALPIGAAISPTMMSGSVAAALTNNSPFTTGASLSANVDPIYQGFIDPVGVPAAGTAVRTLWNSGSPVVVPVFTASGSGMDTFSNELGPNAISSIGVRLHFDLSPGDSILITGIFQIEAVPAPAGLSLFAIFGAVASRRRRR